MSQPLTRFLTATAISGLLLLTACYSPPPVRIYEQSTGKEVTGEYGTMSDKLDKLLPNFSGLGDLFSRKDPGPAGGMRIGKKTYKGEWVTEAKQDMKSWTDCYPPNIDYETVHYVNTLTGAVAEDGSSLSCAYNGNGCKVGWSGSPAMEGQCRDSSNQMYTIKVYPPDFKRKAEREMFNLP